MNRTLTNKTAKAATRVAMLLVLFIFGAQQAEAQKRAAKAKTEAESARVESERQREKEAAGRPERPQQNAAEYNAAMPAALLLVMDEKNDNARQGIDALQKWPGIELTRMSDGLAMVRGGDPLILSRLRQAFPELLLLTPMQFSAISKAFAENPDLMKGELAEKMMSR